MPGLVHEAHAANRALLATDIANVLADHTMSAFEAEAILERPSARTMVTELVSLRRGRPVEVPSEATFAQAVVLLAAREKAAVSQPDDPFLGLPGLPR